MAALWLGLVEGRCLRIAAESAGASMTAAEQVKLLDAAMRSRDAASSIDGMRQAFEDEGRRRDAVIAAVLRTLIWACEIETVIQMRAEWSSRGRSDQPLYPEGL